MDTLSPSDDLRYGIIGTGMMGIEHIENIRAVDHTTITAVSDPDPGSRETGVAAAGGAEAFVDHRQMLESGLVDALVIASPNYTHVDVLADVLETDIPVLVEKPLCTTTADCQRMIELAKGRKGIVWVGLEYRYMPPVTRLIDEVQAGAVGDTKMVSIREHRFPFLVKVGDWNRFSRNTGGTWVEKCCHFFDLMNLIIGDRPEQVYSSGGQVVNHLDETYDGETSDILDSGYVIVDYPGNVRAMLDLCMYAEATHNQEEISVVGTTGKVEALIPENVFRHGRRGEHSIGDVHEEPVTDERVRVEGYHHGSSYLEHVDFANAVRNGTEPLVTLEDGLWSVAIGEAAHRSIAENRPVAMHEMF